MAPTVVFGMVMVTVVVSVMKVVAVTPLALVIVEMWPYSNDVW